MNTETQKLDERTNPAWDPYAGNVLIKRLDPIPSPYDVLTDLTKRPRLPPDLQGMPRHLRIHWLMDVRGFHFPSLVEQRMASAIDLMIRQNYKRNDPSNPKIWARISAEEEAGFRDVPSAPSLAACAEGIAGVGKTATAVLCLERYRQTIPHESFPGTNKGLLQIVWLSVAVPPSGTAWDLVRRLMQAFKDATGTNRFDAWLTRTVRPSNSDMRALDEWLHAASTSFLGLLHLDEVQNLFRLASLRKRKSAKGSEPVELAIVEDKLLKWILDTINAGRFALLLTGTPDGVGALSKRLATQQRVISGGYFQFEPLAVPSREEDVASSFFGVLAAYQYVDKPIKVDLELVKVIIELTAGIQRVVMALWMAAHRVAFDRNKGDLLSQDFVQAAQTWLAPLAPAIAAYRKKDFKQMANFEDLVVGDTPFWRKLWVDLEAA